MTTLILGSSPNALAAAAQLASAAGQILVLEPSGLIGGPTTSAPIHAGFVGDLGLTSGRLAPALIHDLRLAEYGLDVIERPTLTSLLPDGRSLTLSADPAASADSIRGFSAQDAERYPAFCRLIDLAVDFLRAVYADPAPAAHQPGPADMAQLVELVGRLRGYGRREMTEVMRLLVMSIRDLLDEWFESPALKGLLATLGVRNLMQGPFAGGTTFNLLHQFVVGDGIARATARGGLGALSAALAAAAQARGVTIRSGVGPLRVLVSDGAATGVQLASGEVIPATQVISDYDARHTFTQLVPPPALDPEFNRAVRVTRYNGAVARLNLALRELPAIAGLDDSALRGTLVLAPSLPYLERAYDDAKVGRLSASPFLEVTIPSLADPGLAPAGQHVMSIWLQYAPFRGSIPAGAILESALAALDTFAPDLRGAILHAQVLAPQDLAARFDLSEGHLTGGDLTLAQALFLRPIPGYAQHRTPIAGLYLCGATTHPGGVSGLAGLHAARVIRAS